MDRLRRPLFGRGTEKTSRVLGAVADDRSDGSGDGETVKEKRPGHGRHGVGAYHGADQVKVAHPSLKHGDRCPACEQGKVYARAEPATLMRVKGRAPLSATVYELDRLRCNSCRGVFTVEASAGVGTAKYDESAAAMTGPFKYGAGFPFYRLEKLEMNVGIPFPAAPHHWIRISDRPSDSRPALTFR